MKPEPLPGIGTIVLFRISPTIQRPLLVVHSEMKLRLDDEVPVVWGELFLRHDTDNNAPWVLTHAFFKPTRDNRTMEVKNAYHGDLVGNWLPLPSTTSPTNIEEDNEEDDEYIHSIGLTSST